MARTKATAKRQRDDYEQFRFYSNEEKYEDEDEDEDDNEDEGDETEEDGSEEQQGPTPLVLPAIRLASADRPADRPRQTARKSIPITAARRSVPLAGAVPVAVPRSMSPAPPAARADGWAVSGTWAITTDDKWFSDNRRPFEWSFFSDNTGVSYFRFDNGPVEGIAKLEKSLTDIVPPRRNKSRFTWRGREQGEGEMQINDSSNTGEITFKQQAGGFMVMEGRMHGAYCGSQGLMFIGFRVNDTPADTSNNWASYNAQQYDYERRARWR